MIILNNLKFDESATTLMVHLRFSCADKNIKLRRINLDMNVESCRICASMYLVFITHKIINSKV